MIRPEKPDDLPAIHAVNLACFTSNSEARLVCLLREAGQTTVSLVAEVDGSVVGYVAFSPVSVASGVAVAGLAPLAVVETHRGQGIAAELVRTGLQACHDTGFGWVVVLGETSYYSRFGFTAASEFGLSDEYGGGADFQAIELKTGSLPVGAGLVKFAPEFAVLG